MAKIHITLLGKESLPVFYPIVEFHQRIVYLIGTKENKDIALTIERVLNYLGIEYHFCEVAAFDILETSRVCDEIHNAYAADDEFLYNITGGTKPMAIGALSAAKKHASKIIYTNGSKCIDINTYESVDLQCKLDSKVLFIIQGQQVKEAEAYVENPKKSQVSWQIMDLILNNNKIYKDLSAYREMCDGNVPNSFNYKKIHFANDNGHVIVLYDGATALDVDCEDSKELLFEGRWWETLVADTLSKWSNGRYGILQNVKFKNKSDAPESTKDKNEIDIVVNLGTTFVMIECKSGNLTQNEIYKMDYVRNTYGSDKSKSVLVSFYPVKNDLREKAKESQIDVICPRSMSEQSKVLKSIPTKMEKIIKQFNV